MYDISVNGKYLDCDVMVPKGSKEEVRQGNNYTCMKTITLPLQIKEGNNVVLFEVGEYPSNLDYINIRTSASIHGFIPQYWEDETQTVISLPTSMEDGKITLLCQKHGIENSFVLPSLKEENGYLFDEETRTYSFFFAGEKYEIGEDGRYAFPKHVHIEE